MAAECVGDVDILINNAAVLLDAGVSIKDVDPGRVLDQFAVNAVGPLRVTQAFLPGMISHGWGPVVMVSSAIGLLSNLNPSRPGYSVSKAALNAITILLAGQTRDTGVLVNALLRPPRVCAHLRAS
jgi:NAD(P)-dependent dehydrogenase (short-subunit alcohol dehydrogenase family)